MKKIAILSLASLILAGCGGAEQAAVKTNTAATNNAAAPQRPNDSLVVSSHSTGKMSSENATPVPKSETKTKWTQSGNPIDTTAYDTAVKEAESKLKSNPNDENLKKEAAEAFVKRGLALTDARQYASAIGDYRRALKLDPANEEAKKWVEQIIGIYESINREYPKEGEEPPPLPFKKES